MTYSYTGPPMGIIPCSEISISKEIITIIITIIIIIIIIIIITIIIIIINKIFSQEATSPLGGFQAGPMPLNVVYKHQRFY